MKTRILSQLEVAITDMLVSLEEEFGFLPEEDFSRLEKVLSDEFQKGGREKENCEAMVSFGGSLNSGGHSPTKFGNCEAGQAVYRMWNF